jgi:tRNA (mo5U34)-methyltransferase
VKAASLRRRIRNLVKHDVPDFLAAARLVPWGGEDETERLRRQVKRITWFHQIDLGHGIVTPGPDPSADKLKTFGIPERLDGLRVLDIGAWDGFFSFEAERRGARDVLATDSFSWSGGGWGTKAGFNLVHRVKGSRVRSQTIDVLDLHPDRVGGRFDLVLCLGVLYHMQHPLLALERAFSVTKKQLILETHVDMLDCDRPALAFYPGAEVGLDPTNWCGPNPQMVVAMLKTVGFREVQTLPGPVYFTPSSPRMVFHAWR